MKKSLWVAIVAAAALTFGTPVPSQEAHAAVTVQVGQEAKVTASSLYVRSLPSSYYGRVIGVLYQDTIVKISSVSGSWAKISYNGGTGYVNANYLQPISSAPSTEETSSQLSAYELKVVELTNAERAKNGLPALQIDAELSKVARMKSQDMYDNNYFSHTSPTYGSPFDMMKTFGITYRAAGENIAMGQQTPEEVVNAWMNSSGHRANILNASFTHIGVGYVSGKNIWTQMFIGK